MARTKLMYVLLAALLICPMFLGGGDGHDAERKPNISFGGLDHDGDRIDDDILEQEPDLPVWTFVHTSESKLNRVSSDLSALDCHVKNVHHLVPVISARFGSLTSIREASELEGVVLIEAQRPAEPMLDVSAGAVKAEDSDEYSPQTARTLGLRGQGVNIAFLDTGIDDEHPTFEGATVAGVDLTVPDSPLTPRDGTHDPDDLSGHGTAVAAVAVGRGNAEGQYVGVAPEAGMIDVKVIQDLRSQQGPFAENNMLEAIEWCSDNAATDWGTGTSGIDILSISLGTGPDGGAVHQALDAALSDGLAVVIASGNSGSSYGEQQAMAWPDDAVIVSGVDDQDTIDRSDDDRYQSSTYGPRTDDGDDDPYDELKPDISAPCVGITTAASSRISPVNGASGWTTGSGTSFAAPHVAGAIALMLEAKPGIRPSGDNNPIVRLLHSSAETRGEPYDDRISDSFNGYYGYGMLDAYEAAKAAKSYTPMNHRPEIKFFSVEPNVTTAGSVCKIRALAVDIDEEPVTYTLEVEDGTVTGDAPLWDWEAPTDPGTYTMRLEVEDPGGAKDSRTTSVLVREGAPNRPPVITSFRAESTRLSVGGATDLTVVAVDQDGDPLSYEYSARYGSVSSDNGPEATYTAPDEEYVDQVTVVVSDTQGATDSRTLDITVRFGSENSPPTITLLVLEPNYIEVNSSEEEIILYAQIQDPDGSEDIGSVTADTSQLGGSAGIEMKDDGTPPDDAADDMEYSLKIYVEELLEGVYTIEVKVYDQAGGSDTATIQLSVGVEGNGTVTKGKSSSVDILTWGIGIVVILVIIGMVIFFVVRKRRVPTRGARAQSGMYQGPYSGSGVPRGQFPPGQVNRSYQKPRNVAPGGGYLQGR